MLFSSTVFLFLFLPITIAGYYLIPVPRLRNPFLLTASLFFYAWGEVYYVLVMAASIGFNYLFGLAIDFFQRRRNGAAAVFILALAANLGILGFYKYANFLVANFNQLGSALGFSPLNLTPVHLPIGISFFTFKAITYVVDVYRRKVPVQKNPGQLALYISLFPYQIAGPIVRYQTMDQQLAVRPGSWEGFSKGAERFILGLGKKMILADTFGKQVDLIFSLPTEQLPAATAWLGIILYTLQLYFDFSGYSDMAIGLGKIFGFSFPRKFQLSLYRHLRPGILAPLAYYAVRMVSGLSVHPAGRKPRLALPGLCQSAVGFFPLRVVARGELEFRHLGDVSRDLPDPGAPGTGRPAGPGFSTAAARLCPVDHHGRLGLFPGGNASSGPGLFQSPGGLLGPEAIRNPAAGFLTRELTLIMIIGVLASTPVWTGKVFSLDRRGRKRAAVMGTLMEWGSDLLYSTFLGFILLVCAMLLANKSYSPFIYFRF